MARSKTVTFSCLIICLFVFLNFVQALRNDIPITDWIRAVTPFLFIGLLWAAKEYIFVNEKNKLLFFSTLLLTIFLFSCRVIFVYFDYHLYKTAWYYLHENVFTLISENDLSLYPSDSVFYFKRRITTILPESTNVLVPLGSVIGSFLFIFTTKKAETVLAILVLLTSMMAVTLTTTRSMILSISVVILMMGFVIVLFYRPYTRRYLLTVSMLIFSPYIISNLVSLNDVYNNRLLVTISGLNNLFYQPSVETQKSKVEDQPSVETQKSKVEDENMNARLEEYKKAFAIFLKNPILGAGFGVKHDMSFDTGHGYILKQRVAYIHNWVLYFLMVGGVVGLLIYSLFLAFPFFTIIRSFRNREYFLIAVTIALLGLYALFFAVFRLISFNIFLALCWGYMLAFNNLKKE